MRALISLAAGLALTGAAIAQPAREPAPSIVGTWAFNTSVFGAAPDGRGGCTISGTMTISQAPRSQGYVCSFIARERCKGGLSVDAEQRCSATRKGASLEITSSVLRVTPAEMGYAPDNWSLTIRSNELMTGELRSADTARATFRRGPAMVS